MERSAEWNDELRVRKVGLSDTFGPIGYEVLWSALKRGSGHCMSSASCAP